MRRALPFLFVLCAPIVASADDDTQALHSEVGLGTTVVPDRAQVTTEAGYDGGAGRVVARAVAEGTVIKDLGIFAAVTYGEETEGATRPAIGAAYQLSDPRLHAVGARLSVAYKPEGFDEPEGEFETVLMLSHIRGPAVARVMGAFGRDPDGHDSDVEAGLSYQRTIVPHVAVGALTRFRYAIASKDTNVQWDLIGGVDAEIAVKRWRVEGLVGASADDAMSVKTGVLALVAVGLDL